jgi:phage shock protein A
MGGWQQLHRFVKANLSHWLPRRDDPEVTLERLLIEQQEQLSYLRQTVAAAIASQKRLDRHLDQAERFAASWYQRAEQALHHHQEDMARDALARYKSYQNVSAALQTQRQSQVNLATQMKQQLATLEVQVFEAQAQRDLLVSRARTAEAVEQLYGRLDQSGTRATLSAFERMEEKVHDLEFQADAIAQLSSLQLEQRIAALGQADAIEAELERLKEQCN